MIRKNEPCLDGLTRRHFLEGAVYGTLGLVIGLGSEESAAVAAPQAAPFAAENPLSRLVLVRNPSAVDADHRPRFEAALEMVDQAILALSGERDVQKAWGRYIDKDDVVGVKITRCQWMRIGTEEVLVRAIVRRLQDVGVSDDRIFAQDGGMPLEKCTALINAPSVKIHTLTGIAAVMKNYINLSGDPKAYHYEGSAKLGEIWHLPHIKGKTRLIIADMLRPYFGPGPQINPAHRWDYKGVLVGTDPAAVETAALAICREKRRLFKGEEWPITPPPLQLHEADKTYRLGTADPTRISLARLGWQEEVLI